MRWRGRRMSSNVEDQTGGGGLGIPMRGGLRVGGKGGLGCGTLVVIAVVLMILGVDPMQLLGQLEQNGTSVPRQDVPATSATGNGQGCERSDLHRFSCTVLADTEDTWSAIFKQSGSDYPEPTLVFYAGRGESGCGTAQSATGPFYCPADSRVYQTIR